MKHLRKFNENHSDIIDRIIDYMNSSLTIDMLQKSNDSTEKFSFIYDDSSIELLIYYGDLVKYTSKNFDSGLKSRIFIIIDNKQYELTQYQNDNLLRGLLNCYWNKNRIINSIHKYFKKDNQLIDKNDFIGRLIEFDVIKDNSIDILSLANFFEFYTGKRFFRYKSNMITLLKKLKLPIIEY